MSGDEQNDLLRHLQQIQTRFEELRTHMADPEAIADMKRYVSLSREYSRLEPICATANDYISLLNDVGEAHDLLNQTSDPEMRAFAQDTIDDARTRCAELEQKLGDMLTPADPDDAKNAILEIRAGTGGDEAALFAGDLARMYLRYCENQGWQTAMTSCSEGSSGGYKEIIFTISGTDVYGNLKYESGVHRVQRIPATETQGRIHTSAATVAVLPEADAFDVEISEGLIKWDTFRSGGAGGQNVNKVESGVRLRYPWRNPETGDTEEILIECTETRDQPKNKERALTRLRSLIYDRERNHYDNEIASRRRSMVSTGDRSAKIRTYNFPQGRVTDHRIAFTSHNLPAILNGDIQEFINRLSLAEKASKNLNDSPI